MGGILLMLLGLLRIGGGGLLGIWGVGHRSGNPINLTGK